MTAHKHAAMIKAKADNMDLVVFSKHNEKWIEVNGFPEWCMKEYFLCLPQHKEACLHWLNGGEIEMQSDDDWMPVEMYKNTMPWHPLRIFMEDYTVIRIKPRKEKRWIAACNKGYSCIDKLFDKEEQAKEFVTAFYPNNRVGDFQFIEIEVEI